MKIIKYFNKPARDKAKAKEQVIDTETNLPVISKLTNQVLMRHPVLKKDVDGVSKVVYGDTLVVLFEFEKDSNIKQTIPASKLKEFQAEFKKEMELDLVIKPDTAYVLGFKPEVVNKVDEDGNEYQVCKATYYPARPSFKSALSL